MQAHLLDEQLLDLLAGSADAETRKHVAACSVCRNEEEILRGALAQYHETTRAAALRPEGFWQWQHAATVEQLTARPTRRLAWAGAVAIIVFAAGLLVEKTPPAQPVAERDPDEALLAEIERSVRRELPRALEPAAMLAQEVSRSAQTSSNP